MDNSTGGVAFSRGGEVIPLWSYLLDGLALAYLADALLSLLLLDETAGVVAAHQSNRILLLGNVATYAYFAARILASRHARANLLLLLGADKLFWLPLLGVITLAFASALWSQEPGVVLRRAIALGGTCVAGVSLALRYSPRQFVVLVAGMCTALAMASLLLVKVWPEKGIMQSSGVFSEMHFGRWRGVFRHKNHLGAVVGMGMLSTAGLLALRGRVRLLLLASLLLCSALLLFAESLTSLLAVACGILALAGCQLLPRSAARLGPALIYLSILPALGGALALHELSTEDYKSPYHAKRAALAAKAAGDTTRLATLQAPERGTRETGGEAALPTTAEAIPEAGTRGFRRAPGGSGRGNLWRACWQQIKLAPLGGYGFGAFWRENGPAEAIWASSAFYAPTAHNGWLDLALHIGLPGALLGLAWVLWIALRLLRSLLADESETDRVALVTLIGLFVGVQATNLAESALFRQNSWLFAVAVACAAYTSLAAARANGRPLAR